MTDQPPRRPRKAVAKRPAKKTAPARKLAQVTPLPQEQVERPLLIVLNEAVEQMAWLKPSDEAMVELAREYCRRIDDAKRIADELDILDQPLTELALESDSKVLLQRLRALEAAANITKVAGWVGPHLANALRDLGGAPGERKGLENGGTVNNRLAELRKNAAGRKAPRAR